MEKTISSINTIKYLDHNGDYQIKTQINKPFKKHTYKYQKESMADAKKRILSQIEAKQKELDALDKEYQKLFIKNLLEEKDKLLPKLVSLTDNISMLEKVIKTFNDNTSSDTRYIIDI